MGACARAFHSLGQFREVFCCLRQRQRRKTLEKSIGHKRRARARVRVCVRASDKEIPAFSVCACVVRERERIFFKCQCQIHQLTAKQLVEMTQGGPQIRRYSDFGDGSNQSGMFSTSNTCIKRVRSLLPSICVPLFAIPAMPSDAIN